MMTEELEEGVSIEYQVSLYKQGVSIGEIARRLGVSKQTISTRFTKHGVIKRSLSEAVLLSVKRTGKHGGRLRKYTINELFFDELNPVSSYVIGYIQADGTIGPDRFSVTATANDGPFLEQIASHMGSRGNVDIRKSRSIFSVTLNGEEAITIATILYQNAEVFLPRKMEIFQHSFQGKLS
jgi:hypothetical protein